MSNMEGCGSVIKGRENFGYEVEEQEVYDNVCDVEEKETDAVSYPDIPTIADNSPKHMKVAGDAGGGDGSKSNVCCSLARFKGIVLALLSTVLVSMLTVNIALLAGSVKGNEIVFIQMFFFLLFSLPLGVFHRASPRMSMTALLLVLYRCVSGTVDKILAYFAFQVMAIGNAKAILYSSPVFTSFFSCLILHDSCDIVDFILCVITLSGVILVIQPPFIFGGDDNSEWISLPLLGAIFCLICAIILGTSYVTLRKLSDHQVHATTIIVYFAIIGMIISGFVATILQEWVIPGCGRERQLLIMNGTFAFLSQLFLTLALKYETPTTVALIRTTDVLFTFVLDYFFFGTVPNPITITGATVIVGSLVTITLRKWWTGKKQPENMET